MTKVIIDGIEYIPKEIKIETWTDPETGLIWEKQRAEKTMFWKETGAEKTMLWKEALEYAKSLGSDWRLPTIQELLSLIDFSRDKPACKITNTHCSYYWSSTTNAGNTSLAWSVDFLHGGVDYDSKSSNYYVRCVKEGDNYAN